jgi:hypothetical protein
MAEHSIILGHCIQFHNTSILVKKFICVEHLIRKAIEIGFHPDSMNREEEFSLKQVIDASYSNPEGMKKAVRKNVLLLIVPTFL